MTINTDKRLIKVFVMQLVIVLILFAQGQQSYSLFYPVPRLETNTMDPIYGSYYVEGVQVNELIYSRLWTWDEVLSETPDLATMVPEKNQKNMLLPPKGSDFWRWQVSIHKGLKWPDGEPLTTKDIKFSYDLYRSDQTNYADKNVLLSNLKKIRIIDDTKLEFQVDAKDRNIARYVIPLVQILPEHILLVPSLSRGNSFGKTPLGSGPYQYVPDKERKKMDQGQNKTVFKSNPNYHRWGKDSNIGHVKVLQEWVISDIVRRLINAQRTEDWETLDIVLDIPKDPRSFETISINGEQHLNITPYNSNSWYGIALNCEAPLLNNRDVRMALTYAFNVDRAINDQYAKVSVGSARVSVAKRITGPFNPVWGLGDNNIDENPIPYDLKKAEQLLDQSGTWYNTKKKMRYYKDPKTNTDKPVTFTLIYNSGKIQNGTPEKSIIGFFIESLRRLGIEVKDIPYDAATFRKTLEGGKGYDMVFQYYEFGWGSNAAPLFTKGDEQNITNFNYPLLDDWFEKFNTTTKQKQRILYSEQIHQYIHENAPYIFLYSLDKVTAFRKELKTLDKVVPLYFFTHIGEWYFEDDY